MYMPFEKAGSSFINLSTPPDSEIFKISGARKLLREYEAVCGTRDAIFGTQ